MSKYSGKGVKISLKHLASLIAEEKFKSASYVNGQLVVEVNDKTTITIVARSIEK